MSGYAPGTVTAHPHALMVTMRGQPMAVSFHTPSAGTAWGTANRAIYVPILIWNRILVRKLFIAAGSTGTSNFDVGLYNAAGTLLVAAGATAKVASSTEQVVDVTDTPVGPGLFYLGVVSSSATDTFGTYGGTSAPVPTALGLLAEASAYPLPSSATFAVDQTLTFTPLAGLLFETTVS